MSSLPTYDSIANYPPGIAAAFLAFAAAVQADTAFGRAAVNFQAIAATAAANPLGIARQPGTIGTVKFILGQTQPAVGESAVFTVKKNGVAVLSGPVTIDHTHPAAVGGVIDASGNIVAGAASTVAVGDEITCDITYTAGGGPAHPNVSVFVQWQ